VACHKLNHKALRRRKANRGLMIKKLENFTTTTAELVGVFEHDSDEWHAARSGVGGSDVGAILGLNPWESAFTRWAKKTGKIDDSVPDNMAMRLGREFEAPILKIFAETHPHLEVFDECGSWRSTDRPFCTANPDGMFRDVDGTAGIIEIKTSRTSWDNGVPAHYRAQVLHYMYVMGVQKAYVVGVVGWDFVVHVIERDQFELEANLARIDQWWDCVQTGTQPDWDGSANTYDTVRKMNPDLDRDEEIELGVELGVALVNAANDVEKAQETLNELKSVALSQMGTARTAFIELQDARYVVAMRQNNKSGIPHLVVKR
jgi:putative phage-type endonuclease